MTIHVDIVTPERLLISDDVDMITIPGGEGQMGIMGGHAPLLSTMDIGEIVLHKGAETQFLAVAGGVVEVRPNKVTILADVAEAAEEIDENRAEAAREKARESLADNPPPQRRVVIEAALRRSNLRLKVARRRRGRSPHAFESDSQS
ncbi:MAG: F0F1 ATP synthase subunit epsilon [Litorilinea sp.]